MFKSDGSRQLSLLERLVMRIVFVLRRRLLVSVRLVDKGKRATYLCETALDAQRPISLWVKEQGTMEWIDSELRDSDVFLDIGANIGIYSIAAGLRLASGGAVYAFEPHKVNALSLMRNVQASGLSARVKVFSCALSDREGMLEFNYVSLASASTASQLGHNRIPGGGETFVPIASEYVFATSVDRLLEQGAIRAPSLVKIDVDGNEIEILHGMQNLLRGASRPRSLQVELNVNEQDKIIGFMEECGYRLISRNLTYNGKKAQTAGVPLDQIAHNAIFTPA